ncbi:MAG: SWIM zinc finger family protein [Synergistaceae bacterium]|nr:SWIM zinc finger family protein [Synergistaceae bacterium]
MPDRRHKWEYKKPRATRGGIKSRTLRGRSHRSNWWSGRWMEILEEFIDTGRLTRGKSYARKGQVVDIEIEPGLVSASVQGTRKKPYQIKLGFETVSDEAREILLFRFRERASFAAQLLAGEMPEEMVDVFKEAGIPLFPNKSAVRRFKCTCPDDATPCKHIVAVLFLLGEVFDDDPFLLLKLRGIDKNVLIGLLTMESTDNSEDMDLYEAADNEWNGMDDLPVISGGADISENGGYPGTKQEDLPLDRSWYSGNMPTFSYTEEEGRRRIAALEVLNEFPFWRGEHPFRQSLSPYYERASALATEILTGEKRLPVGRPKKLL